MFWGETALRTFKVLLHHTALATPSLHLVTAANEAAARQIADRLLEDSPDCSGVEVWKGDRRLHLKGSVRDKGRRRRGWTASGPSVVLGRLACRLPQSAPRAMSAGSESRTPAPLGGNSVAVQWVRFQRTQADLERRGGTAPEGEWDNLFRMERSVLCGPVTGRADAIAKLEAAARSFSVGERYDGADQEAVASVIRWLEAL